MPKGYFAGPSAVSTALFINSSSTASRTSPSISGVPANATDGNASKVFNVVNMSKALNDVANVTVNATGVLYATAVNVTGGNVTSTILTANTTGNTTDDGDSGAPAPPTSSAPVSDLGSSSGGGSGGLVAIGLLLGFGSLAFLGWAALTRQASAPPSSRLGEVTLSRPAA